MKSITAMYKCKKRNDFSYRIDKLEFAKNIGCFHSKWLISFYPFKISTMNLSRAFSLLLIIIGGFVAIYARAGMDQNQYVLIGGIVLLMIGVYRISRNIPSKNDQTPSSENDETL